MSFCAQVPEAIHNTCWTVLQQNQTYNVYISQAVIGRTQWFISSWLVRDTLHCTYMYLWPPLYESPPFPVGIPVNTPLGPRQLHCAMLLCCVDLPARALVLNMKQYNGKFGCSFCEDEGKTLPNYPLHRFWLYNPASARSHQSLLCNARNARRTGEAVRLRYTISNTLIHS